MQITDTIADMLTRVRNANTAKHDTVDIPASNMKKAIAQILVDEGFERIVEGICPETSLKISQVLQSFPLQRAL